MVLASGALARNRRHDRSTVDLDGVARAIRHSRCWHRLAIVKDDAVVVTRGYGPQTREQAPVDARTLFGIASNTKAFTARRSACWLRSEKIEWDRGRRYLPAFAMWDPFVTREITVRDSSRPSQWLGSARRSAVVAGIDLRPQGDRERLRSSSRDSFPHRLRL